MPGGSAMAVSGSPEPVGALRVEFDPAGGAAAVVAVRDRVGAWLRAAGADGRAFDELLIALGEACANVVDHSGAGPVDGHSGAWVQAALAADRARLLVVDHGRWKAPDPGSCVNRGRGLLLMKGLTDRCLLRTGAAGTVVELHKERVLVQGSRDFGGSPVDDAPPRLRIQQSGPAAVALSGEIDITGCSALREAFAAAAPGDTTLTVDLLDVDYLDSAGVSVLVEQAARSLRLRVRAGSVVATVVEICGLATLADVDYV